MSLLLVVFLQANHAWAADCDPEPPAQNHSGGGSIACPCFVPGEQAGSVFDNIPVDHYPIEIRSVGIGWGTVFGGQGATIERAIHIYEGALPDPGTPSFSLVGPQLTDGAINVFDLQPIPGDKIVDSGPFTVAIEFETMNVNQVFVPSIVNDGNGCQAGRNLIFAQPGGWMEACGTGMSGDWVITVTYSKTECDVPIEVTSMGTMKANFKME